MPDAGGTSRGCIATPWVGACCTGRGLNWGELQGATRNTESHQDSSGGLGRSCGREMLRGQ